MKYEITVDGVQYVSAPEKVQYGCTGCTGCAFDYAGYCTIPLNVENLCSQRRIIWIKQEQYVTDPTKFRDVLLDAIKAGKELETTLVKGEWRSLGQDDYFMICTNQYSDKGFREYYRIKPEVPKDKVTYMFVEAEPCLDNAYNKSNLKLTFDGTTGKLKSADIIEE